MSPLSVVVVSMIWLALPVMTLIMYHKELLRPIEIRCTRSIYSNTMLDAGTNLSHLCIYAHCMHGNFFQQKKFFYILRSYRISRLCQIYYCWRQQFKEAVQRRTPYDTVLWYTRPDFLPPGIAKMVWPILGRLVTRLKPVYCDIVVLILKCIGFRYKKRPAKYTPALQKQYLESGYNLN